jgi:hypothetical protein
LDATELLGPGELAAAQLDLGLERGNLRLGLGDLGLEGARINLEQRRALGHELTLLEAHRLDRAAHAGAHLDGVGRLQAGGEFLVVLHLTLHRGHHRDRRRPAVAPGTARPALLLAAGGEDQGEGQQGKTGGKAARHAGLQRQAANSSPARKALRGTSRNLPHTAMS